MKRVTVTLTADQITALLAPLYNRIERAEQVLSESYQREFFTGKSGEYIKEVVKEREDEIAFLRRLANTLLKAKADSKVNVT